MSKTSFGCSDIGQDTVLLTATDNYGNIASQTAIVTVQGIKPGKPSVVSADTTICKTGHALLTINAASATAYQWYYEGTPISGAVAKYLYRHAGGPV